MKLILLSNILEHKDFPLFVRDIVVKHPDANFLVAGDLLNIFPEPGEDLAGSIYSEIYGLEHLQIGMDELIVNQFKDIQNSRFIEPLRQMFLPMGKHFKAAQALAQRRYKKFFEAIVPYLSQSKRRFIFIPGNMDYPYLAQGATVPYNGVFTQLDVDHISQGGVKVGGIGGIPNTVHPFRGTVEISPYEMTEAEYERRLYSLWGADVVVTHVSPEEFPPLEKFIKVSPLKVFICRAPFNFKKRNNFRGLLEHVYLYDKMVINIRPFECPNNYYLLSLDEQSQDSPQVEMMAWTSGCH